MIFGIFLIYLIIYLLKISDAGEGYNIFILLIKDTIYSIGLILFISPLLLNKHFYLGGWMKYKYFVVLSKVHTPILLTFPIIAHIFLSINKTINYFSFFSNLIWYLATFIITVYYVYIHSSWFYTPFIRINNKFFGNDQVSNVLKLERKVNK